MTLIIPSASSCLSPVTYENEAAFEQDIVENYHLFFGEKTLFIPKSMIFGGIWNNTTPDGFLFDCRDARNPRFYIIEVELSDHSFRGHMRDQIDNFLAFFKDEKDTNGIIDKVYDIVSRHDELASLWNDYCDGEMYRLMMNGIRNHHGILVIFEKKNNELEEKFDDYGKRINPSWKQKVQRIFIQKYQNDDEVFFHQEGGIGGQEQKVIGKSVQSVRRVTSGNSHSTSTEEDHLQKCLPSVRETYEKIKAMLLENGLKQKVVGTYIGFWDNGRLRVQIHTFKGVLHVYVLHENYRYRHGNKESLPDVEQKKSNIEGIVKSYRVEAPNRDYLYFYLKIADTHHMDELLAYIQPTLS